MADIAKTGRARTPRTRTPGLPASAPTGDGFMDRVVALLSPHERMALHMRHGEGLADDAIAARMHLPESIVRDLLRRGEVTIRAAQLAFLEALHEQAPEPAAAR